MARKSLFVIAGEALPWPHGGEYRNFILGSHLSCQLIAGDSLHLAVDVFEVEAEIGTGRFQIEEDFQRQLERLLNPKNVSSLPLEDWRPYKRDFLSYKAVSTRLEALSGSTPGVILRSFRETAQTYESESREVVMGDHDVLYQKWITYPASTGHSCRTGVHYVKLRKKF